MESPRRDLPECDPCTIELMLIGLPEKRPDIDPVLRPLSIVSRQDLERQEMPRACHGNQHTRKDFEYLRLLDQLLLDPRRCKQEINDKTFFGLTRRTQADGGEAAKRLLLYRRKDGVAASREVMDERLGTVVIGHGNRQVEIPRVPGFCAGRYRKTSYQRTGCVKLREIGQDSLENCFEASHALRRGQGTGVPALSPCSAPGLSLSHALNRASICSSVARGSLRRSFCRIIATPAWCKSNATRIRWAA